MKKRLLTLSMVGLMTLGLASCSSTVTSKKDSEGNDIIFSIKDANNNDVNYTANDLLKQYASTETGVKAYYDAIYDVLIRKYQEMNSDLTQEVEKDIEDIVNECKTNAANNGTKYKTELSKKLESEGVDNLGELRELKELEHKKTKYETEFYDDSERLTKFTENYIEEKAPYHIRHILVKTDDVDGSSVYNKEISSDESKKIYSVISRLASGKEAFGDIAYDASDDSSNTLYGSVGIMETDTSFVSEFKYSVYYYDVMLSGKNDTGKTKEELFSNRLNVPTEITLGNTNVNTLSVLNSSVGLIPYSYVKMFDQYAETTKTVGNKTYTDEIDSTLDRHEITSSYYPRNVLFNTYFNNHGLSFITSEGFGDTENNPNWTEPSEDLKAVLGSSFNGKILTDNGNPILVTYNPSTGLHFMIIEKSPFSQKYDSYTDYSDSSVADGKLVKLNSLKEELLHYYNTDVPSTSANINNDNRYVTYIKTTRTEYDKRAETIKTQVKKYDANIQYQVFESLLYSDVENKTLKSDFTIDSSILTLITDYIEDQRNQTKYTNVLSEKNSWTSYVQLLEYQSVQKAAKQLNFNETKAFFTDTKDL